MESTVTKGETAQRGEVVTTTDKILEFIGKQDRAVTLKEINDSVEVKASSLAGFLVMLCKSGKLVREKIERPTTSTGPKLQWAYKLVAIPQQNQA
jgi:predicted transcriptional regulator of viral defense system